MIISEIVILERFRKNLGDLIPLEKSIHKLGLLHPIVVSENNELIAGQRRLVACKNLEWEEVPVTVINIQKLRDGEIDENQIREDFTSDEQIGIADYVEVDIRKENHGKNQYTESASKESLEAKPSKTTQKAVAEKTGISFDTLRKKREIQKEAKNNPKFVELYKNIDNPNSRDTTNSVHLKLSKLNKKRELTKQTQETQVILPDTITIHNQEFQTAPIQDNSVSLIFTDPPYHNDKLSLFEDLAKQAARVLKEGGSLMTFVGQTNIPEICDYMRNAGLEFHWPICVLHTGRASTMHSTKTMIEWKPILWFTKGKYQGDYVRDLVESKPPNKDEHDWAQSTEESDYYIKHLTIENEIVYDPFLGSGTFGVSAKKLKRQFIGCEKDEEHYNNARRIISNAD